MNTKKADWINKPYIEKKTLHSISAKADGKHTVLFVVGEDDEVRLSAETALPHGFLMLHTPDEFVLVKNGMIEIAFEDIKASIPLLEQLNEITFKKAGKEITIKSGEKTLLSLHKDAFLTSAAFGITFEGTGEIYLEVF